MRSLVVYESMYGNTHTIAEAIGAGLRPAGDCAVVPVGRATAADLDGVDLLVVGGPTHVHGMSRPNTRKAAPDALKPGTDLHLDEGWDGDGVREWLDAQGDGGGQRAAAFDTRVGIAPLLSGRASKGIAKELRAHGFALLADPESFLVDKQNHLEPGEEAHARHWAEGLVAAAMAGSSG